MKKWAILAGALSLLLCSTAFAAVEADWDAGTITSTGEASLADAAISAGGPQTGTGAVWSEYQTDKNARKLAESDARNQLEDYVKSIQVTTAQTVGDLMNADVATAEHVNKLLQDAAVVTAGQKGDKFAITMSLPIYGINDSVGRAVLPHIFNQAELPKGPENLEVPEATGVIVDCTGLSIKPVMDVTIKDTNGREIYFYQAMLWDKVVRFGMAAWGNSDTVLAKAGAAPLTVKAVSLDDQGMTPVISAEDADRILAANDKTGCLRQCAVVIKE